MVFSPELLLSFSSDTGFMPRPFLLLTLAQLPAIDLKERTTEPHSRMEQGKRKNLLVRSTHWDSDAWGIQANIQVRPLVKGDA